MNGIRAITACFKIYRRSFLNKNNLFFINDLYHEDVLFSFLCSKYASRMMVVDTVFYAYLQRRDSIVHTPTLKKQIHKLNSS